MKKVSIIIPVYNVVPYLRECVESVLKQTYDNLEIILVDDGSTDGSERICDEYKESDHRICVIHQANQGLSAARNVGIKAATGDYLYFLDSDDYISKVCIDLLMQFAEIYHADLVVGQHVQFQDGLSAHVPEDKAEGHVLSKTAVFQSLIPIGIDDRTNYTSYVISCNKLISHSVMDRILFPSGRVHEDEFIAHELYGYSKKAVIVEQPTYFYRIRPDSITNRNFLEGQFMDQMDAAVARRKYYKKAVPELYPKSLRYSLDSTIYYYLTTEAAMCNKKCGNALKKCVVKSFGEILRVLPKYYWKKYLIFLLNPQFYGKKFCGIGKSEI